MTNKVFRCRQHACERMMITAYIIADSAEAAIQTYCDLLRPIVAIGCIEVQELALMRHTLAVTHHEIDARIHKQTGLADLARLNYALARHNRFMLI